MKEYRDNLENLTSKLIANLSSSVAAYNLKIMLKKRWIENTKNYKILSHINKRQEERLEKILPKHRL